MATSDKEQACELYLHVKPIQFFIDSFLNFIVWTSAFHYQNPHGKWKEKVLCPVHTLVDKVDMEADISSSSLPS